MTCSNYTCASNCEGLTAGTESSCCQMALFAKGANVVSYQCYQWQCQDARWMFIGEAPGAEEDARGEPFVGQAGRLLDNMLAAVGLGREPAADAPAGDPGAEPSGPAQRRESVYIANVIKCRPPGNRNPEPEEVDSCKPYLLRQIQLLQPRIIVVMGRFAVQALLATDASIASLRGRVHGLMRRQWLELHDRRSMLQLRDGRSVCQRDLPADAPRRPVFERDVLGRVHRKLRDRDLSVLGVSVLAERHADRNLDRVHGRDVDRRSPLGRRRQRRNVGTPADGDDDVDVRIANGQPGARRQWADVAAVP